jgi:hypothetical protein
MPTTHDEILEAALKLPETERLSIATQLLGTLSNETEELDLDDEELIKEWDRRFNDGSETIPASELRKRV